MVVNVPALTDADTDKILLANMPTDGAAPSLWYPPFWLDSKYSGADGTTGIVAYRADQPFTYTAKSIPILTKTLKFAAIPSILDGLQITKDGTSGVAVSAGHVRYLDSNLDWQEVATPAQSIAIGAPTGNVETLYVVVYDLQTSPKLDVYKPAKDLFDAAPNAATVDPNEPAIIIGRVDLDGDGDIIAIFNDGIHAGLEAQKAEDLRELMGVIQHNIEPKIEATYKTTLSFVDLPDKYIIGYTNFGKAKPDNRFPYIGAFIHTKPNTVLTEFIDSNGGIIIQSTNNIASPELEKYTADSNPAGTPLKRDEFVMHPIFVYLDLDSSPVLKYAIVRSAVVLRKSPLSPLPLEKQIKKYMLEETLGGTELPQFVTDFCALCGFLVVDDTMDLRTTIEQAKIIPAAEGFSSIQDRPSSLVAPSADDSGLLVVKEGKGAVPIGLPKGIEGGVYVKENGHIVSKKNKASRWCQLTFSKSRGNTGKNSKGTIDSTTMQTLRDGLLFTITLGFNFVVFEAAGNTVTTRYTGYKDRNPAAFEGGNTRVLLSNLTDSLIAKLFGIPGLSTNDIHSQLVHANFVLSYHINNYTGTNTRHTTYDFVQGNSIYGSSRIVVDSNGITIEPVNYINNHTNRLYDITLKGATAVNGAFTNYGTPVLVPNYKKFNTELPPNTYFTSSYPKTKFDKIMSINAEQAYFDTNNSPQAALIKAESIDGSITGTPFTSANSFKQWTKTASSIMYSIDDSITLFSYANAYLYAAPEYDLMIELVLHDI